MIFQLRELAKAGKAHVELCVCDESSCDLVLHRVEANNDSSAGMDLPSSFRKKIAETLYADVCCGNAVAFCQLFLADISQASAMAKFLVDSGTSVPQAPGRVLSRMPFYSSGSSCFKRPEENTPVIPQCNTCSERLKGAG